ncbi:hypothetical protein CXB77_04040 [Chromatium okenii]|uniref:2-amino-4-hydroxy-6-hydroxymethyldihydropteridine pyrophosphokinase n=1 Tax=Chromatium okenii TaxID=61644 RepID=A0A2S7XUF2_9GAMM|nr:hypothetical protein CXB77_04040 [Chromatium okenii]
MTNQLRSNRAYLALGSNINAEYNISRALTLLQQLPNCTEWVSSHWYLTRPWGMTAQADFINLVVGVTTHYSALELFAEMQRIELALARCEQRKMARAPLILICCYLAMQYSIRRGYKFRI